MLFITVDICYSGKKTGSEDVKQFLSVHVYKVLQDLSKGEGLQCNGFMFNGKDRSGRFLSSRGGTFFVC